MQASLAALELFYSPLQLAHVVLNRLLSRFYPRAIVLTIKRCQVRVDFHPASPPYQSSLDVLLLAGLAVLRLAPPGLQGRGLQGAAEGEGEGPGPVQRALVHGVQVDGGLLLALTARQEGDSFGEGKERSIKGQIYTFCLFSNVGVAEAGLIVIVRKK